MLAGDLFLWRCLGILLVIMGSTGLLMVRRSRILKTRSHSTRHGFSAHGHVHRRVESQIAEFRQKLSACRTKHTLLNEYSVEYFYTFQDAGWGEFNHLLEELEFAEKTLDSLMESGEFLAAETLVNLLMNRLSKEDALRAKKRFSFMPGLIDWQSRTSALIQQLAVVLEGAAQETQEIGIKRARSRKPTLLAVREIQNSFVK